MRDAFFTWGLTAIGIYISIGIATLAYTQGSRWVNRIFLAICWPIIFFER